MLTSRVTSKGQMTIPKTIRDYLGISAGDRLTFIIRDGEVIFYPVKGTLLDLRGSIQGNKQPEDLDAVRKVVREKIARKSAQ
ncbi:MAG TPA: AbrB/MazE/SpoVT family DNA-binding domain-containing protein [Candidatus Acetothermia bacterium]|nr:AbrB/MazE/SpoVT family DNA-binding domain-containing protein [Candidatus Acetothermia bacterium]